MTTFPACASAREPCVVRSRARRHVGVCHWDFLPWTMSGDRVVEECHVKTDFAQLRDSRRHRRPFRALTLLIRLTARESYGGRFCAR